MKPLDVVATLEDLPDSHLAKGQVGTVLEVLATEIYLVEFSDLNGAAYAIEPIPGDKLMLLRHAPALAA